MACGETDWRSWPLFRPTSTVQMHNENSGLGIQVSIFANLGPLVRFVETVIKALWQPWQLVLSSHPSSRFSGSIQASALDESLASPTSSSIPSYASGCTASRIRGRPCFRP